MSKVLITGATGFIGSHVAETFCTQRVTTGCLVRKESSLVNLQGLPVKLEYGDMRNPKSLRKALKGYSSVIHLAAWAHDWGAYETFYQVNVEGTLNLLGAAVENNIRHVIITSSVSVYGEENSFYIKDENSPDKSHYPYFLDQLFPCKMNYYRDTKAVAKEKAIAFAKEQGLNLTILEPVWVYGEREFNTGFLEYLKTVKTGIPFLPGSKKNKFHCIYVKDLARAYYLAFQKKLPGVESIIIGCKEAEKMEKIYTLFSEKAGLRKPKNLAKFLVYPAGFSLELLSTLFCSKNAPLLTRGRVNMFYDNIEYDTRKAERLLGFRAEYSLEEGIERTVNWYREQKLI